MMSPEYEPTLGFTIDEQHVDDINEATEMRHGSWIDTYVNAEIGATREWIDDHFASKLSDDEVEARKKRFLDAKLAGTYNAWVARDAAGHIIGQTTPFIESNGTQRLGSIYIDKAWLGKGVGAQLMQKALDWLDPTKPVELGVVTYNERAKAFYRKWGFVEIPGSEHTFENVLPEVRMIRQPTTKGDS